MPKQPPPPSPPTHILRFIDNIKEVDRLITIKKKLSGKIDAPYDVMILDKSALVLLIACWEAYVEDLATLSFNWMLKLAKSPDVFPSKVLVLASESLKTNKDERKVWELAGKGWKNVLKKYLDINIKTFHTPYSNNVDSLFKKLIGKKDLISSWKWKGISNKKATEYLDSLVTRRCEVAHQVSIISHRKDKNIEKAINFIRLLAIISSNEILDFIQKQTGTTAPSIWSVVSSNRM